MSDKQLLCSCLVDAFDDALLKTNGNQFKVFYFLARHTAGKAVQIALSEIGKAINMPERTIQRAIEFLVAVGLLAVSILPGKTSTISVPGLSVPVAAAPAPVSSPQPSKPDVHGNVPFKQRPVPSQREYTSIFDTLIPFTKTIREPLSDNTVRQALQIGADWNRNGFQVSAMISRRMRFTELPNRPKPQKWIYVLNGLRMGFESEAREQREMERRAKSDKAQSRRVDNIAERRLPLVPIEQPDFDEYRRLSNAEAVS